MSDLEKIGTPNHYLFPVHDSVELLETLLHFFYSPTMNARKIRRLTIAPKIATHLWTAILGFVGPATCMETSKVCREYPYGVLRSTIVCGGF